MVDHMSKLTDKQQLFIDEYLTDFNATQAAIRAGYSEKTARRIGSENLSKPDIQTAIRSRLAGHMSKLEITQERILTEMARMAFYDPAELIGLKMDDQGNLIGLSGPQDIANLPEDVRRAIVGWGYDRNMIFTVKLADKSKALDQLARHLGLFNDKLNVNVTDGLADRLRRAKERAGDDG